MSFGNKLKEIRKLRGFTQKELGVVLGFPIATADIRIAQYESGSRNPNKKLFEQISAVLNVNPAVFMPEKLEIECLEDVLRVLLYLDEHIGITLSSKNDNVVCSFNNSDLQELLHKWKNKKLLLEGGAITKEEYLEWMLNI